MANKSLTDLTARTATADSDLIHVNSGGTDYKETKLDFLQGGLAVDWATDSLLTSQVNALPKGSYFGVILALNHQTETGVPQNASFYVHAFNYSNASGIIYLTQMSNGDNYYIRKYQSTWESSWTKEPTRAEITDMVTYTSLAPILKNGWSLNGASYYGKIGDLGFVQVGIRNGTMNTVGFTLPNGYKPNEALIVPILTAAGVSNGYAYFETSGDVTFYSQTYNSGAYFNAIYRRA